MKTLLAYWPMINILGTALVVWITWSLRQLAKQEIAAAVARLTARDNEIAEDVLDHGARLIQLTGRVDEVEKDVLNLPTKADLARVEGEVKSIGREVSAVNSGVQRIEGFFIGRGMETS